ncbi:HD domain-containing protein [Exiguobacterium flavidum]|uniref:HD domain-containing protein n=1 Tax=Exiguobacterium flavidum TaxID=2184695 RepID=UPI000DF79220|nr:HD domain-containing protein [Exiguobacterium flavidum]
MVKTIEQAAEEFARSFHADDFSGHDFAHIERVRRLALSISEKEGGDRQTIELAALLHDVADGKLGGTIETVGTFLDGKVPREQADHILSIIDGMSFRGGGRPELATIEGRIVQDADRLDAIGAIGIARTFQFAGKFDEPMHVPGLAPRKQGDKTSPTSAINHFSEKLFLLKELMNTETARKVAEDRDRYMHEFVERFLAEWEN